MYEIDHPNIIKLHNHFEEEVNKTLLKKYYKKDFIYLVLEYSSGGQLW